VPRPGTTPPAAAGSTRGGSSSKGFIDFDYEITLLTVRAIGAAGEVETHFCEPIGHVQVSGDYVESWQPQADEPRSARASRPSPAAVTGNLGGRGLFGVELFVKGDRSGSPKSARARTTPAWSRWLAALLEFELHARAILGLPVDVSLREPGASAVIYGGMDAKGIAFDGVADALRTPGTTCGCSASRGVDAAMQQELTAAFFKTADFMRNQPE
jgi:phosphoribosylglycinamide formyltransferase 2